MKLRKKTAFYITAGVLIASVAGCHHPEPASEPSKLPATPVRVAAVQIEHIQNQVELQGNVQAINRSEIAAKISGSILKIPVKLGSKVQKGDVLVELTAGEIDAKLQQAKTQLDQAKRNAERERRLLQKNAATPESVKSLDEMLRIAESAHNEAQAYKEYTKILAPFAGRISKKYVNPGDLATPGKPLLSIEDEQRFQIVLELPETMAARIKVGTTATATIPSAGITSTVTVAEISPNTDGNSRTATTKLDIATEPLLQSGQFARISFDEQNARTMTVPAEALVPYGQLMRIFVVTNNIAHLRIVKTGAAYGANQEILSGLTEGDSVVVRGQTSLKDGQPVILQ